MPRVAPTHDDEGDDQDESVHTHSHRHHRRHSSEGKKTKKALADFEKYTIRENELDNEHREVTGPRRYSLEGGGQGRRRSEDQESGSRRHHHHHRHRDMDDEGKGDTPKSGRAASYPGKPDRGAAPGQPVPTNASRVSTQTGKKAVNPKASKFIQFDVLAFVIVLTYVLAILITVLAVWCYRQDSQWNTIVHSDRPFPNIPDETHYSGTYMYIPKHKTDSELLHAKKAMLRENRWFELMHLMFMSAFLILTIFQLAAYVTRGDEDHSRLIICYYTVFGGLGLIIGLFPLLSWHNQENNYKKAEHYLRDFSDRVKAIPLSSKDEVFNNQTGTEAERWANIYKFCLDVSEDGVTFGKDDRSITLFRKKYKMSQFQTLGFCTHHKFKIVNTILSTIFALFCCAIPCIYCFTASGKKYEEDKKRLEEKRQMQQQRPPPGAGPPPPPLSRATRDEEEDEGERKREKRRERKRSRAKTLDDLTDKEMEQIEKFRRYIEGDDEMDDNAN